MALSPVTGVLIRDRKVEDTDTERNSHDRGGQARNTGPAGAGRGGKDHPFPSTPGASTALPILGLALWPPEPGENMFPAVKFSELCYGSPGLT